MFEIVAIPETLEFQIDGKTVITASAHPTFDRYQNALYELSFLSKQPRTSNEPEGRVKFSRNDALESLKSSGLNLDKDPLRWPTIKELTAISIQTELGTRPFILVEENPMRISIFPINFSKPVLISDSIAAQRRSIRVQERDLATEAQLEEMRLSSGILLDVNEDAYWIDPVAGDWTLGELIMIKLFLQIIEEKQKNTLEEEIFISVRSVLETISDELKYNLGRLGLKPPERKDLESIINELSEIKINDKKWVRLGKSEGHITVRRAKYSFRTAKREEVKGSMNISAAAAFSSDAPKPEQTAGDKPFGFTNSGQSSRLARVRRIPRPPTV